MTQEEVLSLPEAPASATVKAISPNGFECLITIRDTDAGEMFRRLQGLVGYLEASGYTPPPQKGGSKRQYVPTPEDGSAPLCPQHKKPMRQSNYGGYYCTAQNPDGSYCKQKSQPQHTQ